MQKPFDNILPERNWTASRKFALKRLEDFLPFSGSTYAKERNFDFGTEFNKASCLSPYISRRLVLEDEIISKVLEKFPFKGRFESYEAEKFVQEVLWRVYWKAWLEIHYKVWDSYIDSLKDLKNKSFLNLENALSGKTGIDCFDYWVNELLHTGYLHNHSRMWLASIWIFTLNLPWQLGADFFYRNLLDADPASNTLSWRWVGGLQTIGKYYLATKENIKKFTTARFSPNGLFENNPILPRDLADTTAFKPKSYPSEISINDFHKPLIILTEEDLYPESIIPFNSIKVNFDILIISNELISNAFNLSLSKKVKAFSKSSIEDFKERFLSYNGKYNSSLKYRILVPDTIAEAKKNIFDYQASDIIYIAPQIGYFNDVFSALKDEIQAKCFPLRRSIDTKLYPYGNKGFFNFKNVIPKYLTEIL